MVWNQYVYEATTGNEVEDYSDSDETQNDPMTRHQPLPVWEWDSSWEEELGYMWFIINRYIDDAYLKNHLLKDAKYEDFVEFCYEFSDHRRK